MFAEVPTFLHVHGLGRGRGRGAAALGWGLLWRREDARDGLQAVFVVHAAICERDARFPALHSDIVELILARFALPLGRHVAGLRELRRMRVGYRVDALGRRVAGDVGVVWSAKVRVTWR
jgi:hypothetical protein